MKKILVIGKKGQLATALRYVAPMSNYLQFSFLGQDQLNLLDQTALEDFCTQHTVQYDAILYCAAFTAVEGGQSAYTSAMQLNAYAPARLAAWAKERGAFFVYISSDYVFQGQLARPLEPSDFPQPLSVYGTSKYTGEQMILQGTPQAIIVRTAWLFSPFGSNFFTKMPVWLAQQRRLAMVCDQVGSPTSALDLARALCHILYHPQFGCYHYVNSGVASWYDLAYFMREQMQWEGEIIAQKSAASTAPRPAFSVLSTQTFQSTFAQPAPRHWPAALQEVVRLAQMN